MECLDGTCIQFNPIQTPEQLIKQGLNSVKAIGINLGNVWNALKMVVNGRIPLNKGCIRIFGGKWNEFGISTLHTWPVMNNASTRFCKQV